MNRATLFAAAALLAALPARAEDTSDLESLLEEPVISTASKTAETAGAAPATTTVITAEELRRYGVRSLDEALNFLSLGMVAENPYNAVEVGARGVLLTRDYGNHVLLLLDGHALNEQWDGTAYFDRSAAVPWELVDHIEVILGPGSVLYGSNAMLGVINVVTKRAKDFPGRRLGLESDVADSLRGNVGYGGQFELLGRPAEVTAAIDYYGSHGPALAFGPQPYGLDSVTGEPRRFGWGVGTGEWGGEGTRSMRAAIPVAFGRLMVGSLELSGRAASSRRSVPHGWGNFDDPDNWEQDRWASLDARWKAALSQVADLSLRGYYDLYDYQQHAPNAAAESCMDGQDQGCVYRLTGVSRWGGLEAIGSFDWLQDTRFVTLAGVDARMRYVRSTEDYQDAMTGELVEGGAPYAKYEGAVGAYLEQTARPVRWLGLSVGGRLDYDQRFGSHLSPRAAATLSAWEGGVVKAIYAEAFRAPTAFERYYSDVMATIAAPDLRPESVRSAELTVEQRFAGQRAFAGVFRSWWSDLVVAADASEEELAAAKASGALDESVEYAWLYKNAASMENYGVNVGFDGAALSRKLRYGLSATVARASQDDGSGEPVALPVAAQVIGNARVSYDLGGSLPVLALAARHVGERPVGGTTFDPTPVAPAQTELRATVSGLVPEAPGLSYRLLLNYAFADRGPYAVGPMTDPVEGWEAPELLPVPRWLASVGIQYEIP